MDNKGIGLVLEGGGMRGMYTAAVLDVFLQQGIDLQAVVGVSAGAIHGCNYISKQIGRGVRYNLKYIQDKRYMSFRSLVKTGDLFNKEFCYETIPNELNKFDYETFKERAKDIPFYVTCTELETGKPRYIRCMDLEEDMDYMRASASLPLVSKAVERDGMKLLDGGTSDSIPIDFMREQGYKKNIVVLTRPAGYIKKQDKSIKLLQMVYKKYPEYVEACKHRFEQYNACVEELERLEKAGEVLIIRPTRSVKIGRTEKNKDKLKYMYKLGRYDTIRMLQDIRDFIK